MPSPLEKSRTGKGCALSSAPLRLVVLVSGGGSNLQAVMDAISAGELHAEILQVIANKAGAYALERADNAGIPTATRRLKPYKNDGRGRDQYDLDLAAHIRQLEPDLVVLAGWMHILSAGFLETVETQVINLHPALPGAFAGTHAIDRAFEAYQRGEISHSGCMIHDVIPEVDAGQVIVQAVVPITPEDTLETFEERMHQTEHEIIVQAIHKIEQTRIEEETTT